MSELKPKKPLKTQETTKSTDGDDSPFFSTFRRRSRSPLRFRSGSACHSASDRESSDSSITTLLPTTGGDYFKQHSLSLTSSETSTFRPPASELGKSETVSNGQRLLSPKTDLNTPGGAGFQYTVAPPRTPREGHEWVWFPEGYWVERVVNELSKHHKQNNKSRWLMRSQGKNPGKKSSSQPSVNHELLSRDDHQLSRNEGGGRSVSISSDKKNKGLYCKTKRRLKGGLSIRKKHLENKLLPDSSGSFPSPTVKTLEGTTYHLEDIQREGQALAHLPVPADLPTSSSDSRSSLQATRPSHRNRRTSSDTQWSVTSSIKDLFVAKTPVGTPNPESMYEDRNGKIYLKVEISDPNEPTFLPSEARRINTPPMATLKTLTGLTRGFFFTISPGADDSNEKESEARQTSDSGPITRECVRNSGDELQWWDRAVGRTGAKRVTESPDFVLDVPEHLPSSPLCPKNPYHESGGNSICVYHGRRKIGETIGPNMPS